jgi:acetyltransferase-like isoleucine patch superfamily enzyme
MLIKSPRFPLKQIALYGWLPSALKIAIYRFQGYRIGQGVNLGFGSVVMGDSVSIGDHTSLGFFSFIRGRTISLGRHVQIGAATMIDTPHVEIGDGTKLNEQVFIGGLQFPDSRLVVGRNCQIMQMTFLNPTRSIVIGDDTGIGGDCLVFGHTSWLSALEGYPVEVDSIEIGSHVSLAWRVFVLPGVRIGDGAVIGANSLVRGTIPPRCLAIGFPARVVSKEPDFPRVLTPIEKKRIVTDIMDEFRARLVGERLDVSNEGPNLVIARTTRGRWRSERPTYRLRVSLDETPNAGNDDFDVILSFHRMPEAVRSSLERNRKVWFDLEAKERSDLSNDLSEELAMHLRRYGIRFFRLTAE